MERRLNILLVDDDAEVRALFENILTAEGHAVVTARDGRSALDAAQLSIFDVAVVDYQMPAPNGLEVLARLRKIQPNCVSLLVSGGLDVAVAVDAVNRGEASRILTKPFSVVDLITSVNEAVEARRRVGEQYQWSNAMEHAEEERHLRECFSRNLFRLATQPIVTSENRELFGYESLLRCDHPNLRDPTELLRAAERQGRLQQLGAAVMAKAARILSTLAEPALLFVNLHPMELEDPEGLIQRLAPLRPSAGRVVLEITERCGMLDANHWRESTGRLLDQGFGLAVDDLGAGYSSLSVLAELKPSFIKIDMSIVRGCDKDEHKRRLIELICRFGDATAAKVIAEGIETPAESRAVTQAGAQLQQGFLLGRPQLAEATLH